MKERALNNREAHNETTRLFEKQSRQIAQRALHVLKANSYEGLQGLPYKAINTRTIEGGI